MSLDPRLAGGGAAGTYIEVQPGTALAAADRCRHDASPSSSPCSASAPGFRRSLPSAVLRGDLVGPRRREFSDFPARAMMGSSSPTHALLNYSDQHQWYTVAGWLGGEYVTRLQGSLERRGAEHPHRCRSLRRSAATSPTASRSVSKEPSGEAFDDVVFATSFRPGLWRC